MNRALFAGAVAAALLGLVCASPACAQAEKMDALPAMDRIEQGWIALFDGESLFGWNVLGESNWDVVEGVLACIGGTGGGWLATTGEFGDFELVAQIRVVGEGAAGLVVRADVDGHPSEKAAGISIPGGDQWHIVKVTANGDEISVSLDGADARPTRAENLVGHVGILYYNKGVVEVSSIQLRPINKTPIFNGKDLDGWNIIPDHKSVFSVVDGALNIKDGNGQIETVGLYKDFILQMAIYSNGDHLNSGVFFRGPVGVFWKGYESQVRNQWEGDDRTKPVDFGTGGMYGNQPARKVVSSDREWFYKTILVHDNHMATWINGYLVSDFTDTRPPVDDYNGKAGFVPQAGTIHLQGHDPKTDLSFKNIEIQEYK